MGGRGGSSGGTMAPPRPAVEHEAAHGHAPAHHGSEGGQWHPDTESQNRIEDAVNSGIADETRLTGGVSAKTDLITTNDGTQLVRKDVNPDRELAGSMIGQALDLPAPSVFTDGGYAYMDYVPDAPSAAKLFTTGRGGPTLANFDMDKWNALLATDDGKRIRLLDALIANYDRNTGNILVKADGSIVPIDHGNAQSMGFYKATSHPAAFADFTHADLVEIDRRLARLESTFDQLGLTPNWINYARDMLGANEQYAKGTTNLIAGN